MGDEYSAELTLLDKYGEVIKTLRDIEIENDGLSEESIEDMEEFISVSINKYEADDEF